MFTESFSQPTQDGTQRGWIEVVTGSMFSGKTEELIRRIRRAQIAGQDVAVFKPQVDDRYDQKALVSHDQKSIKAIPVEDARDIASKAEDLKVVGIDEVQFFGNNVVEIIETLANSGKRVIVAGLDMNYRGEPFGAMPQLLARAEFVTKLHAICDTCGNIAGFSHRLSKSTDELQIGEKDLYQARCRTCMMKDGIQA